MTREEMKKRLQERHSSWRLMKDELKMLGLSRTIKEGIYIVLNDLPDEYAPECVICGKDTKFYSGKKGYNSTCGSRDCRTAFNKKNLRNLYGVENPSQMPDWQKKVRKTSRQKYGVDHFTQSSIVKSKIVESSLKRYGETHYGKTAARRKEIRETLRNRSVKEIETVNKKIRRTTQKKYGVDFYTQTDEYKERVKSTNLDKYGVEWNIASDYSREMQKNTLQRKYGVDNPIDIDGVKEKMIETTKRKYGVDHYTKTDEYKRRVRENYDTYEWEQASLPGYDANMWNNATNVNALAKEHGWSPRTLRRRQMRDAPEFIPTYTNGFSEMEIECQDFLSNLDIGFAANDRNIISPLELDVWIPSHSLAIEMNGIYWHSELYTEKLYHQRKFNLAKQQGITLIQFNEIEWLTKRDICENIIKAKLGLLPRVYARKCDIGEIDGKISKSFLEIHHIQGHAPAKVNLALWYEGEIVAVMTFRKARYTNDVEWELIRFCSSGTVVGGFSRLLKYFRKMYSGSIISYSNSNISIGDVYAKNGFIHDGQTVPSYFWVKGMDIKSRYQVQKSKLGYEETEIEYMRGLGYNRYFDAGNERWIMK